MTLPKAAAMLIHRGFEAETVIRAVTVNPLQYLHA